MKPAAFITKNALYLVGVIYLALVLFFSSTPVFWDMYGQVKTAAYFLDTGLTNLLPSGNSYSDNGHFPFYAMYLAFWFKIFGYKLWVAHLSVLPFLLGALFQLRRFSLRFLTEQQTFWVLVLSLFHPAILTQSIYFSQEISIVFFSLWLINALLNDHSSHIALAAVLLCLFNLRGIALCGTLLVYFVFVKKNKHAWYLVCGVLVWLVWMLIHYMKTGWFIRGEEIKEFRALASLSGMAKNFVIAIWKMLDLGSVFAWVAIVIISIKTKKILTPLSCLILVSLAAILVCVPFTNPIGDRYFLLSYFLVLPVFIHVISVTGAKRSVAITGSFMIVLLFGNGMTYPNRYGNAWDCSLKSLPYFKLKQQADTYIADQHIASTEVEAGFQVYFNDRYCLMNGVDREYSLLSDTEMPTKEYVIDSDICNNFNSAREDFLLQHYTLQKEFQEEAVYLRLYRKKTRP